MTTKVSSNEIDPEILAISAVYSALRGLDQGAQGRVIEYVRMKLGHKSVMPNPKKEGPNEDAFEEPADEIKHPVPHDEASTPSGNDDIWNSVSAVAKKWIQRSDLDRQFLATIFSVGAEEIDLIARAIPGKSKRQRMREVILLKCIAAYLGSGVARVPHQAVKEACSHYGALDEGNFATYLKEFSAEVSGGKEAGYTLSPRGLANAADLIKEMKGKSK